MDDITLEQSLAELDPFCQEENALYTTDSGFVLLFYRLMTQMFVTPQIRYLDVKVLMTCAFRMQRVRALVDVNQADIARALRVPRESVSRSVKRLMRFGYLQRVRGKTYQINPDVAFKGRLKDRDAAKRMYKAVQSGNNTWINENAEFEDL